MSNAVTVYVRKPGVARKFKADVVCEGKVRADLPVQWAHERCCGRTNGAVGARTGRWGPLLRRLPVSARPTVPTRLHATRMVLPGC